jgi:hypothetical protein
MLLRRSCCLNNSPPAAFSIDFAMSTARPCLLEVDDEGFAVEVALVVGVHLDTRIAINTLVNHPVFLEDLLDLVDRSITRDVGDEDCEVLRLRNLLLLLGVPLSPEVANRISSS